MGFNKELEVITEEKSLAMQLSHLCQPRNCDREECHFELKSWFYVNANCQCGVLPISICGNDVYSVKAVDTCLFKICNMST